MTNEPTRLVLVASDLLSTLEYLKSQWEHNGRIDAINMIHVYESIALAKASEANRKAA